MTSRERPLILLTGGTGQIGFELVRELAALGDIRAPARHDLDLAHPGQIRAYVRIRQPDLIVNAAAYTEVDRAETDRDLCYAVNAEAPDVLAQEAVRCGAGLIHYSTDYVFDGAKQAPYVETDPPSPLNVYGASKLAGERAVEAAGGAWIVLRTSWVFGARGRNFVRTILRLAREAKPLRVVYDQHGAPTWCRSIAALTGQLLAASLTGGLVENLRRSAGLYHAASAGSATWLELARATLAHDPARHEQCHTALVPITSREFETAAARPAYSVLSSEKLLARFGLALPAWDAQLGMLFAESAREIRAPLMQRDTHAVDS